MATLLPEGKQSFTDGAGKPLVGGKLYTYDAGTSTPRPTYADAAGTILNTNPVVLDARGEATVFWSGVYKVVLTDATGTTIWTVDYVSGVSAQDLSIVSGAGLIGFSAAVVYAAGTVGKFLKDLTLSAGSALIGYIRSEVGSVFRTLQAKLRDNLSVTDFGADPTGVADSTAAFNLATRASETWSSALEYNIQVPPGKYKLNGTVYIRKGQTLKGSGQGVFINASSITTEPVFSLGNGLLAGVPTADPGGSPVKIENMWTSGGPAGRGVVYSNAGGFAINGMFITSAGTGLEINGADGIISDVEIDQSLSAIQLYGSQNITFANVNIYLPNYGVTLGSDCRDIVFSGGVIEYPQYAGVLFDNAAANIKGVNFVGTAFTMNAQYVTFLGYVYKRASAVEAQFTGCSFRNWYGHAVNDAAGVGCNLTFSGCVFDGSRTTAAYAQSTTAKVLNTGSVGAAGVYTFLGCEYRNLLGEIATLNDGISRLSLVGGLVQGCDANAASQKRFNVVTSAYHQSITVKGVVGFPYKTADASNQYVVLPYWGGCTQWKIAVRGNTFAVGDTRYSRSEEGIASVSTAYNGASIVEYCDYTMAYQTPPRAIPGNISLAAAFGTSPGGATNQAPATKGTICVSSPTHSGNAQGFEFYAETTV